MKKTIYCQIPKQLELDFNESPAVKKGNIIYAIFGQKKYNVENNEVIESKAKLDISVRLNEILARYK